MLSPCSPSSINRYGMLVGEVSLAFKSSNSIGSHFRFKDVIPDHLCSNIVYLFTCRSCQATYIGSTVRNLSIRIFEHKGRSYRTNKIVTNPSLSHIREHSHEKDHCFSHDDFSILFRARDSVELRIAESLLIKKMKPELNRTEFCVQLYTL